jgi:hypothetical protein
MSLTNDYANKSWVLRLNQRRPWPEWCGVVDVCMWGLVLMLMTAALVLAVL